MDSLLSSILTFTNVTQQTHHMLKKLTYGLLFLGFMLLTVYIIPVPIKDITSLYKGKKSDLEGLLSFRAIPTKSISIDHINWEYLSTGTGERHLLFLHGMGGAYDIWWQQIEALEKEYHIISTTLPEVYSLDEAVAGVKAILDKENITKVSIIGSSMGGLSVNTF
jgi:maspardin